MSEWRPISTAPTDGTIIDVWRQFARGGEPTNSRREANILFERGKWLRDLDGEELEWGPDEYGQSSTVTHWMPLPPPPEEAQS